MAHFQEGVSVYIPTYWLCDCNSLSSKGNYAWWPVILVRWHFTRTEGRKIVALTPLWRSNPFKFYVDCIFRIHVIRCCSLNNSGYRKGDVHLTVSAYLNFSTFFLSLPSTCLSYSSPIVILSIANIFYWFFFCSRMIGTFWVDPWTGNSDCGTSRRRR